MGWICLGVLRIFNFFSCDRAMTKAGTLSLRVDGSQVRHARRDSVELHVYLHRTAMKAPSGVSQEAHSPDPRSRDGAYGGFGLADLVPSWVHGTTVGYVTGGPYGKAMVKTGRCNATHTVHYRLAGTGGDENMQTALHVWQALQQTLNTLPLGVVAEVLLTW